MTVPVKQAATVIPILDSGDEGEPKLLLLRRSLDLVFAPGHWVFPGGALEESDFEGVSYPARDGSDSELIQAAFNAAVREAHEECSLVLDPASLTLYSHWVTPAQEPRRFATWHCVVTLSRDSIDASDIRVDGGEIIDYQWMTASEALAACQSGDIKIMPPTYVSLLELQRCRSIEMFYRLIETREPPRYVPKRIAHSDGVQRRPAVHRGETFILYEEDVAYHNEDLSVEGEYHRVVVSGGQYTYINTLAR